MNYRSLECELDGAVARIWLNRQDVRNALDEVLISEITGAFGELAADAQVRVVVLGGRGSAFCAGADLHWMRRMASHDIDANRADALRLAEMLHAIHGCTKPVIARVHGPAFAGGMGLAAACDLRVGDPGALFSLSEVRIGLVPATISPYIVQAMGLPAARRYMLTADRLPAREAWRLGFLHELADPGQIDNVIDRLSDALVAAGPKALAATKTICDRVGTRMVDLQLMRETAEWIADARASSEGREGVGAFLEKRRPAWAVH